MTGGQIERAVSAALRARDFAVADDGTPLPDCIFRQGGVRRPSPSLPSVTSPIRRSVTAETDARP